MAQTRLLRLGFPRERCELTLLKGKKIVEFNLNASVLIPVGWLFQYDTLRSCF